MEMLSKKVPNCAKRQPAENPSAGCLTVCCCFFSASPDPVELASPFPQALVQPGAQGCHALLCPGEGLRLNVLGLFKADVLIDPGLDGAIVHLSHPLEAVAEGAEGAGKNLRLLQKVQGQKCEWIFHRAVSLLHQAASVSRRQTLIPAMVSANTNQKMHITRG